MRSQMAWLAAGTMFLAAGASSAEPGPSVQAEIQALRAEIADLKAREEGNWLNERRREEIKSLIHEVLSDAETRASLAEGGLTAGWKKNFFLASEDGNFLLQIEGQIQPRYIFTRAGGRDGDENEGGFQQRRTKVGFFGHVFDPKLKYKVKAGFERSEGPFVLEEGYVNYEWADGYYIRLGQFKGRFLHEELVSSTKQQAVERSNVNEFFTLDYSQGVEVGAEYESWNWSAIVHDGREADNVNWADDATHFAIAGRAELLLAGTWKQFSDFAAWDGEPMGLMIGAGLDYEQGEGGEGSGLDWTHMFQYTVDASFELSPFNLYAAYVGRHIEFDPGAGPTATADDAHQWGVLVQAGVFVIPDRLDLFARWEYLQLDGIEEVVGGGDDIDALSLPVGIHDHQHIFTFGGNYYFRKHDVKVTLDLLWAPGGIRAGESGGGTLTSNDDDLDQCAIRGQFQLLF
jgi:hypothetical protein